MLSNLILFDEIMNAIVCSKRELHGLLNTKKILNNFLTIMNAHLARIIKEQKKSDIHSKYTNFITPQSANCHFSCI